MQTTAIAKRMVIGLLLSMFLLTGCGQTTTSRSLSGAGLGAAAGGAIGSLSGDFGTGALIGAGVGAVSGFLYDQHKKGNID
jgi:hypothetical protein